MSEVFFNGPAGRLEGKYNESTNPKAPVALVLHTHPLYGGTMNNKVEYNIYKTLANNGFTVLRMNFRGVGRSAGKFDEGIGEMMDAATALDWLQLNNPLANINLVAGFSFGAWIAMQLIMRRPEITNFIAVSPNINKYDFSFVSPCPIPGLILQGDMDSVVSEDLVHEFAQKLSKHKHIKVEYRVINGADHFFREKIDKLSEEVSDYLKTVFGHQPRLVRRNKVPLEEKVSKKSNKKIFLE